MLLRHPHGRGVRAHVPGFPRQTHTSHVDRAPWFFGYLGFDITAPLMHLTSGELVELIVGNAYWPKFHHSFKGNKEIIKNKLLEIGNIRNSLAHFRPIRPDDIGLVKKYSAHFNRSWGVSSKPFFSIYSCSKKHNVRMVQIDKYIRSRAYKYDSVL